MYLLGDAVFSGDAIDYAAVVAGSDADETDAKISSNPWDGVQRWTSARELSRAPLAVLVGLSVDEQLAGANTASLCRYRPGLWPRAAPRA